MKRVAAFAMRRVTLTVVSVLATIGLGCGDSTGPSGSNKTVQIVDVTSNATIIQCGLIALAPDTVYWSLHIVNTTSDTVRVTSVGTSGVVIKAGRPEDLGDYVFTYASVPYNPSPTVLAAHTGDVTMIVAMPTLFSRDCPVPIVDGNKTALENDANVTLVVTTTAGQYNTVPKTIKIISDFSR